MAGDVRTVLESGDIAGLAPALAEDVLFRSPAVYAPYQGREVVIALLQVVAAVFENFRYVNEWRDGATRILFFEANVGDRELQGVDILEEGEDGLVERFHGHDPPAVGPAGPVGGRRRPARRRVKAAILAPARM
jgi:hypothetical protein